MTSAEHDIIDVVTLRGSESGVTISDEDSTVDEVVERLVERFPRVVRTHITETVREEYDALDDCRIRIYVPNLIEHSARTRLRLERSELDSVA